MTPVLVLALTCALAAAGQEPAGPLSPQEAQLVEAMAAQDVHLDPRAGLVAIPVDVAVRDELLEYVLVGPAGATHESLFVTPIKPSVLNLALLALGLEGGQNASWQPVEPQPTPEELRAGASAYTVTLPRGDELHPYVAWRQGDESYFYRLEDLLRNLLTGHSMRRHGWVYLGSRMIPPLPGRDPSKPSPPEEFAADVYQNLINVSFFRDGYTLLTTALTECVEQTIWMCNAWLLPERGSRLLLIFSRERLDSLPASLAEGLPIVAPDARYARGR